MGKRSIKDGTTRVLYKKSYHTMCTQSRTCSGISQLCTKSGLVNIKKNLSETKGYYQDGEKIKRDLSIETDICIIRRYCKKIKNKMSVQEGSRSKYSTVVDTEINTIDEFDADACGSGDAEQTEQPNVNLDVANVVIDNLKVLINNWIQKYLLQAKKLDQKDCLENVFCTILPKDVTDNTTKASSRSTYILNRSTLSEVKNKKIGTASVCDNCKACQNKSKKYESESSCHSTPAQSKKLKVISTLSIPRNLHKKVNEDKKHKPKQKTKSVTRKKLVLAINKSDQLNISSFDFLSVSAETFTRRCANINLKKDHGDKKKRRIVFFPKPFYKSASDSISSYGNSTTGLSPKDNLLDMPSLVQCIYGGDPADIENCDVSKVDNVTMTDNNFTEFTNIHISQEQTHPATKNSLIDNVFNIDKPLPFAQQSKLNELEQSETLVTIDFIDEITNNCTKVMEKNASSKSLMKKTDDPTKQSLTAENNKVKKWKTKRKRKKLRAYSRLPKYHSFQSRQFTFLHKNSNTQYSQERQFLEHFQNIFKYFNDFNKTKDLKLNINVNIVPLLNAQNKDQTTMTFDQDCLTSESDGIIYNVEPYFNVQKHENNIQKNAEDANVNEIKSSNILIPLLDGTLSHSKYLLKNESQVSTCKRRGSMKCINKVTSDCGTITETEFTNDIKELRDVIKNLAKATEDIVKEHVKHEPKTNHHVNNNPFTQESDTMSKGNQSNESGKQPLLSGIKLSKNPKKDPGELYKRLMQKSVSYNVIDSETILRVTDMSSNGNDNKESSTVPVQNVQKSKSLIKLGNEAKNVFTFYCGNPKTNDPGYNYGQNEPDGSIYTMEACDSPPPVCSEGFCIDGSEEDGGNDVVCTLSKACRRRGMGFGEGFMYCLLMWIPFIIVFCLFYQHVLHEHIVRSSNRFLTTTTSGSSSDGSSSQGSSSSDGSTTTTPFYDPLSSSSTSSSIFYVRLSDLGF